MQAVVHFAVTNPIARNVLLGVWAGCGVDLHALTGFTRWSQLKQYDWSVASYRWFSGGVAGLIAGLAAIGLAASGVTL